MTGSTSSGDHCRSTMGSLIGVSRSVVAGAEAGVGHGLLHGFGLKRGAVASSVGHDAHNIVLAGTNDADLKLALETVRKLRSGVCAVRDGRVLAAVALPIAASSRPGADFCRRLPPHSTGHGDGQYPG